MNNTTTGTGKLIPSLLEEPIGGVVPTLDKCILLFLKIVYIGLRILLRISLGKKRKCQTTQSPRQCSLSIYHNHLVLQTAELKVQTD